MNAPKLTPAQLSMLRHLRSGGAMHHSRCRSGSVIFSALLRIGLVTRGGVITPAGRAALGICSCPHCGAEYQAERTSGIRLCRRCDRPVDAQGNNAQDGAS